MHIKRLFIPILFGVPPVFSNGKDDIMIAMDSITSKTDIVGRSFHEWTGRIVDLHWPLLPSQADAVLKEIKRATIVTENGGT